MKINKIRLQNINSLRGIWELDFTQEPFLEASLFSITGATGAGKSTILDAITLALYNQIPRIEKTISKNIIEDGGFILSRNEKECFTEVEYNTATGSYRSRWAISKNRNNTLRDYEMEIVDLSTSLPLDIKKKDVPLTNSRLIGLNYDQFIRSILLSQGGFSRFLDAKKDERAKLLEQITGSAIYRKLGQLAFMYWKEVNKEIADKELLIEEDKKSLLDPEYKAEKEDELQKTESRITELQKERDLLNHLRLVKERIEKFNDECKEKEDQFVISKEKESVFNREKKPILDQHRKLIPYLQKIESYSSTISQKENRSLTKEQLEETRSLELKNKEALLGQTIELTKTHVVFAEAQQEILRFRNDVLEKQNVVQQLNQTLLHQSEKLGDLFNKAEITKQSSSKEQDSRLTEITQKRKETNELLLDLSSKGITADTIDTLKEHHKEMLRILQLLKEKVGAYSNLSSDIQKLQEIIDTESGKLIASEMLNAMQASVLELEKEKDELTETLLRIQKEKKEDVLSLRKTLKENEPCVVCGSLHHPYTHSYIDQIDDTLTTLSKIKKQHEHSLEKFNTARREKEKQTAVIENNQLLIEDKKKSLTQVESEIVNLKEQANLKEIKSIKVVDDCLLHEQRRFQELETFEKLSLSKEILEAIIKEHENLTRIEKDKTVAVKALEDLYTGSAILQDTDQLMKAVQSCQQKLDTVEKGLKEIEKELYELTALIKEQEEELLETLKGIGYADISKAKEQILMPAHYDQLVQEEQIIIGDLHTIQNLIQQLTRQLTEEKKQDHPLYTKDDCLTRLQTINHEFTQADALKTELSFLISTDNQRVVRINEQENAIAETREKNKKWYRLNLLIGDATGNKFNSFAQTLTLAKLVKLANIHLRQLNDRYLLAMPDADEEEDLIVVDGWMGEERRSVKTLSGGEKFLISLSLSLALSDLASRHVKIETLFIDEGFGTLDPETLDQAVTTLEQLQSTSGRLVGIISHVEELKERIQTQVRLEKTASGFSSMRIISGWEE